jgi:hypothetical protein
MWTHPPTRNPQRRNPMSDNPKLEDAADGGLRLTPCSPSSLRTGEDGRTYLKFRPHGYEYPIELPVITSGSRADTGAWTWNGSLEKPTLRPSIKTRHGGGGNVVSHLWLNDGVCQHLGDSTDGLAGQTLPLQSLENAKHIHPEPNTTDDTNQ